MNAHASSISPEELAAHAEWLRRLAARLVRDPHRAEDVAQETWRRALERPPARRDNLRGWLATAARRVAQQLGRSESARAVRERRVAGRAAAPSAAEAVEQAALHRDLVQHVLDLDEPYRSALLLRYFRDQPPARIAAELGVPRNTVRSHLARGLAQLRERLDASEGGREAWMRALVPLAALPGGAAPRAAAWTPALAGAGAALATVTAVALLVRPPAEPVPSSRRVVADGGALAATTAPVLPAPTAAPEPRAAVPALAPAAPAERGAGALDLRFVDAETGAALPDLEFCVFQERLGNRVFHRGAADGAGTATIDDLPENVILVQTARRPPHAVGFAAVWLGEGERRALEVRVGRGGRVVGRAVDERGLPVAGLEVVMPGGPCAFRSLPGQTEPPEVVARTGDDGRFAVDAVGALPRGVWIVEGEARPETWLPARLELRSERFPCWTLADARGVVRAGEELDVGDLTVPRTVTYAGRVLDEAGEPVPGALVSLDPHRVGSGVWWNRPAGGRPRPGTAEFELEGADVLTAGDGSFRLEVPWSESSRRFLVWTAGGRRAQPPAPALAPAETRDDLVLTVSSARVAVLDLRGPDGGPAELETEPGPVLARGRYAMLPAVGICRVLLGARDGRLVELEPERDADRRIRLDTELAAEDVRSVEVFAPGWLPARVDLPGGFPAEPLVVDLRPMPRVRVRLRRAAPGGEVLNVRVAACRAGVEHIPVADRWHRCCGLGCLAVVELGAEPVDVDLPVAADGEYLLTVYALAGRLYVPGRVLGPVAPTADAADRTVVVVDAGELVPYPQTAAAAAHEQREPPAPSEPETALASAPGGSLRELGYATGGEEEAPPPVFAARLLEADGAPVAEGTPVATAGPAPRGWGREARVGPEGLVEIHAALPPRFTLAVNGDLGGLYGSAPAGVRGFQLLEVDGWSPGVARELRLAPWRAVEVNVHGLRPEEAALAPSLRVAPPAQVRPPAPGLPSFARTLREVAGAPPGTRRFRIELPPGPWVVHGSAGLLEVPPTPVDVRDEPGTQRFDVRVRRP